MFYTYILYLSNNTYYIGYSADLVERIKEHSRGEWMLLRNICL
ncbi:MAG TPA: GIY-YIG nuclease family protein [Patescibacteria group bacterium]|nr:GIY-YIG nuclease family protein [Patescibacteria group bacterium]